MVNLSSYAIVDVREGSQSEGKVLVLLDDEPTAREMAIELRRIGCDVAIQGVPAERAGINAPTLWPTVDGPGAGAVSS